MARKPKIKAPKISRKSNAAKLTEERHVGYETIDWSQVKPTEVTDKIRETLRHYNYFYDYKDGHKWAAQWVKKNRPKDYSKFNKAEIWRVTITLGGLCKMHLNGAPLPESNLKFINENVDNIVKIGSQKKEVVQVSTTPVKTIQDILKEKTSDFIGEVEGMLDMFNGDTWVDWENYSVYNELKKIDAAAVTAKAVVEYYTPLKEEFLELINKKTPDLVEGYSHLTLKQRKDFLKVVVNIIDDANKYIESKKAIRKPRVKKVASASLQVAKVKYQKDSQEYKLASADPISIIGANRVYLFNTKYKDLICLESKEKTGFTISGTTIQGLDETLSFKKKVRKPEETLVEMTTKAKCNAVFNDLKTKAAVANGRLNEETIILKVFK